MQRDTTHHGVFATGLSILTANLAVTVDLNIAISGKPCMVAIQGALLLRGEGYRDNLPGADCVMCPLGPVIRYVELPLACKRERS